MSIPLLRFDDVHVTIGGDPPSLPLQGVDLTISPGETVGIVGESGSGKSMTLRAAIGTLPPRGTVSSGSICWQGRPIAEFAAAELDEFRGSGVAMIFQNPVAALDPMMTVGRHLREVYDATRQGRGDDPELVATELLRQLDFPDVDDILGRYPHQLSGGMAQRVNIAMAMICQPSIIFADEPTTGLDVTTQVQVLDALRSQVERSGVALLLVSHDLRVVEHMADMIGVMYAGKVVEYGPRAEVLGRPAHPYTRALLRCAELEDDEPPQSIPGRVPALAVRHVLCPFRERCDERVPACEDTAPPLIRPRADHRALCHLSGGDDV